MSPRTIAAATLMSLGLAACASPPPPPAVFSDIRFTGEPPLQLAVAAVETKIEFQPTFRPPEIEQNFPVPPQRAVENWVHDRLVAADPSASVRLQVIVQDASARTLAEPGRVSARERVEVRILDEHGLAVRTASAESTRTRSVPPDASPDDRDLAFYNMTRELTHDLTIQLEHQIKSTFFPYVL